jgi:uncharacterized protein (TIGR02001 family)
MLAGAAALALALPAAPAMAQDEATWPKINGNVTFTTDYRWRGVSYSDRDPAIQGSINVATEPGFFFNIWGSSTSEFQGSTVEIDLTGGWTGTFDGITPTLGVIGYIYPGASDVHFLELFGTVAAAVGPATATVGLNIAPGQSNLSRSSRYLWFGLAGGIPDTPITLKGNLGFERGSLVVDESSQRTTKTDWLIGADIAFSPLTLGIAYVGNNLPGRFPGVAPGTGAPLPGAPANAVAKDAIVLTLSASF